MEKTFRQNLHDARKKAGLTQKELAEKSGISLSSIKRYEKGEREPTWTIIETLSTTLNIDESLLVNPQDKFEFSFELFNASEEQLKNLFNTFPEMTFTCVSGMDSILFRKISNIDLPEQIKKLLFYICYLNKKGQEKVCQYAEDLSHINKYRNRTGDSKEVNSPESDSDK